MMTVFLLTLLALLPAGLLMYLIVWMDRNEREPLGLVLKTMMLGALGFIPAVLVESAWEWIPWPPWGDIPTALWDSFVKIAPIEELAKMAPVFLLAWGHPQFNEENDGIVYAGASALGFAAVENVFYVLSRGWGIGLARAVTSLPLHGFTGVVMGYFLGRARFAGRQACRLIFWGFLWAYLAHAVYDTLVLSQNLLVLLMLPMVAAIAVIGWSVLRKGRALSLAHNPVPTEPEREMMAAQGPSGGGRAEAGPKFQKRQSWKAILGRSLLLACLLFWLVLILAMVRENEAMAVFQLMIGGLVLSFVPFMLGILLEISYRSRWKA